MLKFIARPLISAFLMALVGLIAQQLYPTSPALMNWAQEIKGTLLYAFILFFFLHMFFQMSYRLISKFYPDYFLVSVISFALFIVIILSVVVSSGQSSSPFITTFATMLAFVGIPFLVSEFLTKKGLLKKAGLE